MIDPQHPRAVSLKTRDLLVEGVAMGITSMNGLISQGRGEALDYFLNEKTHDFAHTAIEAAAAMFVLSTYPVLCTNGNSVILAGKDYIVLSDLLHCPIEINLFHKTKDREMAIKTYLQKLGAKRIVGVGSDASDVVPGIASPRKFVSPQGISKADVVLVPIEDGDRTEALVKLHKKVITIDLNPLSRTAKMATITIVDNIIRCMPLLIKKIKEYKQKPKKELQKIVKEYNNEEILNRAEKQIRKGIVC